MQQIDKNVDLIPWTFALYPKNKKNKSSEYLINFLYKKGIETRNGFYSPNRLKIFDLSKKTIPNSNFLSKNIICLPIFYDLTKENIIRICKKLNLIVKLN